MVNYRESSSKCYLPRSACKLATQNTVTSSYQSQIPKVKISPIKENLTNWRRIVRSLKLAIEACNANTLNRPLDLQQLWYMLYLLVSSLNCWGALVCSWETPIPYEVDMIEDSRPLSMQLKSSIYYTFKFVVCGLPSTCHTSNHSIHHGKLYNIIWHLMQIQQQNNIRNFRRIYTSAGGSQEWYLTWDMEIYHEYCH